MHCEDLCEDTLHGQIEALALGHSNDNAAEHRALGAGQQTRAQVKNHSPPPPPRLRCSTSAAGNPHHALPSKHEEPEL